MDTMRTIGIVGIAATMLLTATVALADEDRATAPSATRSETGEAAKERMEAARADAKKRIEATRADAKKRMQAAHEDAKERMEVAREDANIRVKAQREKAAQRLTDIQDKVKQGTAQRLATQFDSLNSRWTDHFMQVLDKYDALLEKIQDRADIAEASGKDVASTTLAIKSATTAITSARTAVTAQAAKTYTLDTSTITTTAATTPSGQENIMQGLRKSFQTLHTTLFKDLFALRDGTMKDARKALQNVLQTLKGIPKVDEDHATSTVQESDD